MENDSIEMVNIRLKELAKVVFGSLKEMDLALGKKQGYMSSYLNKHSMLGGETLQFLASRYNVNINWLLTGKGNMLVNTENVEVIDSTMANVPVLTNDVAWQLINEIKAMKKSMSINTLQENIDDKIEDFEELEIDN